jgi:phospho-N-acetylmuramoyl-pentapeptide-transferase
MLDKYFPLYITVFISTLVLTAIIEKKLIPYFSENAKQPIYAEGPAWHMKKSGTPTMGGVAFLVSSAAVLIPTFLFALAFISYECAVSLAISMIYAILNSLIGIADDRKKLKRKENAGLTPMQKLLLQALAGIFFLLSRRLLLGDTTELSFSFGSVDLGFFYYPLALILLIGIVNCANLTDGIDGLATSVAFAIGISLFYISASLSTDGSIIASVILGASVGFMLFNIHPAKIFMGDTGSLFFGSIIASSGFVLGNPLITVFLGGVYVIEGVSVILQVVSYKLTKKRIFKMAPIHHHLEKCGLSENQICIIAIFATLIFSVPAYILYLP